MSLDNTNEVVNQFFKSLLSRYQIGSETSMRERERERERESDFVQLLCYKYQKINFKLGGSYIDSPDWIKKKTQTINPKIGDNKCFQYVVNGCIKLWRN